jgi:hypothetical protein
VCMCIKLCYSIIFITSIECLRTRFVPEKKRNVFKRKETKRRDSVVFDFERLLFDAYG